MLIVTVAATVEPVTLVEAKAHLRVTHTDDDTMIGAHITSAREAAEQITGRALAAATYRYVEDGVTAAKIRLPLWPVATVTALTYLDGDGVRQTMDPGDYTLDSDRSVVTIDEPPTYMADASVTFTVAPALIPEVVKSAIKLQIEDLYTNTGATVSRDEAMSPAAERILYLQRVNLGV